MKTTWTKRVLSLFVCLVLIAAMALFAVGCKDNTTNDLSVNDQQVAVTELGTGATHFTFTVTDVAGKESAFHIHTDKETVGDALLELNLIQGEDSAYGLYVKTVNGTTLDYDTDGKYWAFYVNDEYAVSGVDSTTIEHGATYSFKAE